MCILDNNLDITVQELNKIEIIRIIKISNFFLKNKIDSNNIVYIEPKTNIKDKYKYKLYISFPPAAEKFFISWEKSASRKYAKLYFTIAVNNILINLADFENRIY